MDGKRFDDLTAALAASRRTVLRATGIGAIGAALARFGLEDAAAACKAPGKPCDQGDACCGGSKCRKNKCRCPKGRAECGKDCCKPGQVCLDGAPKTCVNGPLEPGDTCSPKKQLACESGNCECVTNFEDITVCTCRQETCLGFGAACTATSQCCAGGCSGFTEKCEADI